MQLPKTSNGSVNYREFFGTLPPPAAPESPVEPQTAKESPVRSAASERQRSRLSIAQIGDGRASSVLQVASVASKESSSVDIAEHMIKDKASAQVVYAKYIRVQYSIWTLQYNIWTLMFSVVFAEQSSE